MASSSFRGAGGRGLGLRGKGAIKLAAMACVTFIGLFCVMYFWGYFTPYMQLLSLRANHSNHFKKFTKSLEWRGFEKHGGVAANNNTIDLKGLEWRGFENHGGVAANNNTIDLIIGVGFGTTGTHAPHNASCLLGLKSFHFGNQCGYACGFRKKKESTKQGRYRFSNPPARLLAQSRLVNAYGTLKRCLFETDARLRNESDPCPTVQETMDGFKAHIDRVLSTDIESLHDSPWPSFAPYVLKAAKRIRGAVPTVIVTERDPAEWAINRFHEHLVMQCSIKATGEFDFKYLGENYYWCLSEAIKQGKADEPVDNVLELIGNDIGNDIHYFRQNITDDKILLSLREGMEVFQRWVRERAAYSVNLFERTPRLDTEHLALEIAKATNSTLAPGKYCKPIPMTKLGIFSNERINESERHPRKCMRSMKDAFKTGKLCDKIVVFLHFHKAGGTSLIEYFDNHTIHYDLRIDDISTSLEELGIASNDLNLKVNSSTNATLLSDSRFWNSIYERGLDVVNLEYNYVIPEVNAKLDAYRITQLREPFSRLRSTYERELDIKCRKTEDVVSCITRSDNSLESWMLNPVERKAWPGILGNNYYVRMLNGISDQLGTDVTPAHLETAKAVLDTFDTVLILEDGGDVNLKKIHALLGKFDENVIPHSTNNRLKGYKEYDRIVEAANKVRPLFEKRNRLDLELYSYAKQKFGSP